MVTASIYASPRLINQHGLRETLECSELCLELWFQPGYLLIEFLAHLYKLHELALSHFCKDPPIPECMERDHSWLTQQIYIALLSKFEPALIEQCQRLDVQ